LRSRFVDEDKTTLQARFEAQQLAFGPFLFQAARVLRECGALEHVYRCGKQGATPEEVSEKVTGVSLYAARVLLEAGLAAGMLALVEERFCITKVGYLVLRDPMTRVNFDFVHDVCYQGMFRLEESLREGRPAGLEVFGSWPTIYEGLSQLPPRAKQSWFAFDHFYSDGVFESVLPIVFERRPKRILDVGGNTGKFSLQCCAYDPDVRITIVDHQGQLEAARENLRAHGIDARVDGHAADLLDPSAALPSGYDVYWMSQFLDCFGEREIVSILERTAAAMSRESRLFILETFWDRQRYEAGRFSVINTSLYFAAMANGNSKMYHSDRMQACLSEAGLRVARVHDEIGVSHTLLCCELELPEEI
jgi:hypothetical protein